MSVGHFTELSLSEAAEMENMYLLDKTKKRHCAKSMSTLNECDEECDPKQYDGDITEQFNNQGSDETVHKREVKPNLTQTQKSIKVDKLAMLINKISAKKDIKIKVIDALPEKKNVFRESPVTIKSEISRDTAHLKLNERNEMNQENESDEHNCSVNTTESNVKEIAMMPKEIQMDYANVFEQIRKYTKEWVTLETYVYIFGEDEIKHILNEKKLMEYFDKLKISELQTVNQMKYMNICKKLQLQELAEDKFDNLILEKKLKHLPNYGSLKEGTKELDMKVKSFYSGVMYEESNTNFPAIQMNESDEHLFLPAALVTVSQNNMRKKVFLNSINYR